MSTTCDPEFLLNSFFILEDLKQGSRKGKLRPTASVLHSSASRTIQEMVTEESSSKLDGSHMDETFARNVYRLGYRYKGNDLSQHGPGRSSGADEDDIFGDGGVDLRMFEKQSSKLTETANFNREKSRQISLLEKEDARMQKSWWWLSSSSFRKHMLISVGNHVRVYLV